MTIEQCEVVDLVGIDAEGKAVLTISDHLPWEQMGEHLHCLQEKLNTYLRFIESGEIYDKFPTMRNRPIVIDVVLEHQVPQGAQWFFTKASGVIANAGFTLSIRHFSA